MLGEEPLWNKVIGLTKNIAASVQVEDVGDNQQVFSRIAPRAVDDNIFVA